MVKRPGELAVTASVAFKGIAASSVPEPGVALSYSSNTGVVPELMRVSIASRCASRAVVDHVRVVRVRAMSDSFQESLYSQRLSLAISWLSHALNLPTLGASCQTSRTFINNASSGPRSVGAGQRQLPRGRPQWTHTG